jgi:aspartyl protease
VLGAGLVPAVPLKFVRQDGSETQEFRAIVDSGCDRTTFPSEMAAELGIDLAQCPALQGKTAAGVDNPEDESTWIRQCVNGIDAKFWGRTIHIDAFFRNADIPVLLGRKDFFRCFLVLFDERAQRFQLTPYKKS